MENLLAGAFGLIIGCAGILTCVYQLTNIAALEKWSQTTGKIIERGTYLYEGSAMSPPAFRHAPLVRYVYQVDGKEFVSEFIHSKRVQMPEHSSIEWAQKRAAGFADEVTVYYNPQDPAESFLLHTSKTTLYLMIAGATFALLLGLAFLLAALLN
jgi:hypothetical protein